MIFTSIINNHITNCWDAANIRADPSSDPSDASDRNNAAHRDASSALNAGGIMLRCSRDTGADTLGYDAFGLIIRHNHASNRATIAIPATYQCYEGPSGPNHWHMNDAGLVIESNHIQDADVGVAIEQTAHAIERDTTTKNVRWPVVWTGSRYELTN